MEVNQLLSRPPPVKVNRLLLDGSATSSMLSDLKEGWPDARRQLEAIV